MNVVNSGCEVQFHYVENYSDMSYKEMMSTPSASRAPKHYAEHAQDRQFATTLARGLELMRCFTPQEPILGNKELAQRLALPPATVSRLTYTLLTMGYLTQLGSHTKYRLGAAALALGYPLLEIFTIRRRARPLMTELSIRTGGSVSIGIIERQSVIYIEAIRAAQGRVYPLDVGTVQSLAGTALGRACLLSCPPDERAEHLNRLRVKAPKDWKRYGARLQENLEQFSRFGCCISVGEVYPDVQAVAIPLGRIDAGEPAALNCSFQGRDLDPQWLRQHIAPQLKEIAQKII